MTPLELYALAGATLVLAGFWGMVARAHLFWKILGFNLMGSGTFLVLLALPPRLEPGVADPVPQAMVLTGIVVAAAATAVALGMALRVTARTGVPFLEEDGGPVAGTGRGKDDSGSGSPPTEDPPWSPPP